MFSPVVTHPDELRQKIGEYLTKKHTQTDIARLKIALDELRYLVVPINIKPFRDALQAEYGSDIRIVHERGIQEAYSRLTEPLLIGSSRRQSGQRSPHHPGNKRFSIAIRLVKFVLTHRELNA